MAFVVHCVKTGFEDYFHCLDAYYPRTVRSAKDVYFHLTGCLEKGGNKNLHKLLI